MLTGFAMQQHARASSLPRMHAECAPVPGQLLFIFLSGMHACLLRKARFNETRACAQLFRSLFSAVMCGALARAQKVPRLFGPLRLWPAYAVRGFPGAASMVFYYQAIAMLPLSDAVRCPFYFCTHKSSSVVFCGDPTALHGLTFVYFFHVLVSMLALLRCVCHFIDHFGDGQRLLLEPVADSRAALSWQVTLLNLVMRCCESQVLHAQMTLMYSNPALCAVFAWIVGTEAVTCICVAGVTASVVGVVLIAQPPFLFGEAAWDHTRMLGAGAMMSSHASCYPSLLSL